MTDQTLKDIDRAFKALEERDELLDEIRAEIKSKKFSLTDTEDGRRIQSDIHAGFNGGIECALQIIDKYREPTGAESEG